MTPRHIALGLLAAVIWGSTFLVTTVALRDTPPMLFAALRFAMAATFVLFIPRPAVSWTKLLAAGMLLGSGQYGLQFLGMATGAPPGITSLLAHTQAFFSIAFAMIFLGERINRLQVGGVFLAGIGLLMLIIARGDGVVFEGLLLVLLGAVCGGAGNIVLKRMGNVDRLGVAVWMSLAVPVPLLVLSSMFEGNIAVALSNLTFNTVAALIYSSILATVVAFAIWGTLFATYSATAVAPFLLLVPVVGIVLSVTLMDEQFTTGKAMGATILFVGLLLITTSTNLMARVKKFNVAPAPKHIMTGKPAVERIAWDDLA
jgi:O-acetylserine/cysteine efflux transporter